MKLLLFIVCSFFLTSLTAQSSSSFLEKKVQGEISHKYDAYNVSSFSIEYAVHTFVGSGSYSYRWKLAGDEFGASTNENTLSVNYTCDNAKKPECTIVCEITDLTTQKKYFIKKTHIVESCVEGYKNNN